MNKAGKIAKIFPFHSTLQKGLTCSGFDDYSYSTTTCVQEHEETLISTRQEGSQERLKSDGFRVQLSKLISSYSTNMAISRNEAARLIETGNVKFAGKRVSSPGMLIDPSTATNAAIQINGKPVVLDTSIFKKGVDEKIGKSLSRTRVWVVNKLVGELVSESDPHGRPSMIARLIQLGIGKNQKDKTRSHLKPIGRLDMSSEGLMLVTNDGEYARQMELPKNKIHRTYKVRVHGPLTPFKITRISRGMTVDGVKYKGMKVQLEERRARKFSQSTNHWIRLTCVEGKNRIIRKALRHLGCK